MAIRFILFYKSEKEGVFKKKPTITIDDDVTVSQESINRWRFMVIQGPGDWSLWLEEEFGSCRMEASVCIKRVKPVPRNHESWKYLES